MSFFCRSMNAFFCQNATFSQAPKANSATHAMAETSPTMSTEAHPLRLGGWSALRMFLQDGSGKLFCVVDDLLVTHHEHACFERSCAAAGPPSSI